VSERPTYDRSELVKACQRFEEAFGMSSEVFYAAHQADDESVAHIPRFERHAWASFYRDGEPFAEIDANEFQAAKNDPRVQAFAEWADRHLQRLRDEGRIE